METSYAIGPRIKMDNRTFEAFLRSQICLVRLVQVSFFQGYIYNAIVGINSVHLPHWYIRLEQSMPCENKQRGCPDQTTTVR